MNFVFVRPQLALLPEFHSTLVALVRLRPSVHVLVLLEVLRQCEFLVAKLARKRLLHVMLGVVALETKLRFEFLTAREHVTLENPLDTRFAEVPLPRNFDTFAVAIITPLLLIAGIAILFLDCEWVFC